MAGSRPHISLRSIVNVALYTIVIGLVAFVLFDERLRWANLFWSLVVSGVYIVIMASTQHGAGMLAERFVPMRTRRDVAIRVAIHTVVMVLSFALATYLLRLILNFPYLYNRWSLITIGLLAVCASLVGHGSRYLEAFYTRARNAEQAALTAQLRALRAQINPHFLFNSLNSIAALIRIRPQEAEQLTESLADLFRYSLRASEHPTVTLAEEIASLELYLAIERARFGDRMVVSLNVPEHLRAARVPSLLLQPIVENAVKHGAERMEGTCRVDITATSTGGVVHLHITDTGPGFVGKHLEELLGRGTGLANVRDRLLHQFGTAAALELLPNGIAIVFPLDTAAHAGSEPAA
ncbi:MAG TPA: histidine kinase [Candidatus Kapabacteria bacterium]|nr:histidine kinase [Candidatus Kapabacteria bacterium]